MKKTIIFTFILLFFSFSLFAQNADLVTKIIETDKVSFAQVAYFSATYLGFLPDIATEQEAVNAISLRGISSIPENPYKQITYQKFAQICMNTWIKKGGLMYSITKSPRYAFREMQSLGLIDYKKYPNQSLSGKEALNIMSKCITIYEKENSK